MRTILFLAAIAGSALVSNSVLAAPFMETGVIKKINAKSHQVVLTDGDRFVLPTGFSMKPFKVGETVSIDYAMDHNRFYATSMGPARRHPIMN